MSRYNIVDNEDHTIQNTYRGCIYSYGAVGVFMIIIGLMILMYNFNPYKVDVSFSNQPEFNQLNIKINTFQIIDAVIKYDNNTFIFIKDEYVKMTNQYLNHLIEEFLMFWFNENDLTKYDIHYNIDLIDLSQIDHDFKMQIFNLVN